MAKYISTYQGITSSLKEPCGRKGISPQYNWEFVIAKTEALNFNFPAFFFLWIVPAYPGLW